MNESAKTYGVVSPEILKSYDGLSFLKAIVENIAQPSAESRRVAANPPCTVPIGL